MGRTHQKCMQGTRSVHVHQKCTHAPEVYACTRSVRMHQKCMQVRSTERTHQRSHEVYARYQQPKLEKKKVCVDQQNADTPKDFEIFVNITVEWAHRVHQKCTQGIRSVRMLQKCTQKCTRAPEVYERYQKCTHAPKSVRRSLRKVSAVYVCTKGVHKVPSVHFCDHMKCTQGTKNQLPKLEKKKFVGWPAKCWHPKRT